MVNLPQFVERLFLPDLHITAINSSSVDSGVVFK